MLDITSIELPLCSSERIDIYGDERFYSLNVLRMQLLAESLKVNADITPKIYSIVSKVVKTLELDEYKVECFIQNSSDIKANCFSVDLETVTISISSGLINLLDDNELAFVVGHEIGHYLLGHLRRNINQHEEDSDAFNRLNLTRMQQGCEISADRVGLLCCKSVDIALKTIVKTVSGLSSEHITSNFQSFLHQLKSLDYSFLQVNETTHPIFPVRARALLLFSMSDVFYKFENNQKEAPLKLVSVNKKVDKDLKETTQKYFYEMSSQTLSKFKIWFCGKVFSDSGVYDVQAKKMLCSILGEVDSNRLIDVSDKNQSHTDERYQFYKARLQSLPNDVKKDFYESFERELLEHLSESHLAVKSLRKIKAKD